MDQDLESLELKISKFLRAGVLVAGAMMLIGWAANVFNGTGAVAQLTTYRPTTLLVDLSEARANHDWFRLLTYLGLVTLILLPFTRVCLTAVLFFRRREWVLAGVAAFVSMALAASVVLGIDL